MKIVRITLLTELTLIAIAFIIAMFFSMNIKAWSEFKFSPTIISLVFATLLAYLVTKGLKSIGPDKLEIGKNLVTLLNGIGHQSVYALLIISIAAGLGEEILFRGVLQTLTTEKFGVLASIIGTSILFGLAHAISKSYFLYSMLFSILMGVFYHYSNNLIALILFHAIYDFVALYLVIHVYKFAELNAEELDRV